MLQDLDILEDWTAIRKVLHSEQKKTGWLWMLMLSCDLTFWVVFASSPHRRWHLWGRTGWRLMVRVSPHPKLQSISGWVQRSTRSYRGEADSILSAESAQFHSWIRDKCWKFVLSPPNITVQFSYSPRLPLTVHQYFFSPPTFFFLTLCYIFFSSLPHLAMPFSLSGPPISS